MSERISIVVPVLNERENIQPFFDSLWQVLHESREDFEIVFVDDGSTDGSGALLEVLAARNKRIKLVVFGRNYGQTAALAAGFEYSSGDLLVATDADLQNNPHDIPAILAKLREGYDVVACRREKRQDPWLTRRLPSTLANLLISKVSGVPLSDYGCTLRGYRRSVLEHIRLYGEMHRFLAIYACWVGARVIEIPVTHLPRLHGTSKYGLSRTYKVMLDMITVKMLGGYSTKPMHFFGGAGLLAGAGGVFFAAWTVFDKFFYGVAAHTNPLLLLAVFLVVVGVQFVLLGLIAELLIRTYFESQGKTPYIVRQVWNCGDESNPRRAVR